MFSMAETCMIGTRADEVRVVLVLWVLATFDVAPCVELISVFSRTLVLVIGLAIVTIQVNSHLAGLAMIS